MEKRPRPFTAEKRLAEIGGAPQPTSHDELIQAFESLSHDVREVLARDTLTAVLPAAITDAKGNGGDGGTCQSPPEAMQEALQEAPKDASEVEDAPGPADEIRQLAAALKSANPDEDPLVLAREELQTIVAATDKAANEIMDQSDEIQVAIENIRKDISNENTSNVEVHLSSLEEVVTNLMLACEFQDLTGQRVTKVTNALHRLEDRIDGLFQALGIENGTGEGGLSPVTVDDERPDAELLHGPQNDGEGMSQDDIDSLFD